MSDQYTPMIERISEEYDESDSNMVLELAATDQEYADLKQEMSELKHQHPFIEKLLEGDGEVQLTAQEHEILNQYFRLYLRADNMERKHIYFRGHTDGFSYFTSAGLQEYIAKCTHRAKPVEKKETYRNVRGRKSHL